MNFTSTRNPSISVPFSKAVKDCYPDDGGVFVPSQIEDLRRWIYYIDEKTSFTSIAGALTSALIKDEFSPIICETIATSAFPFEPVIKQLDNNLFMLELYHGYTGCYRDFGLSFLASYLETTMQLKGGNTVFLDYTHGVLGSVLGNVLRGKKHIKAVLVYKKGTIRGLDEQDLYWNGGNIYPIEFAGTEEQIKKAISEIFSEQDFVREHNLSVANTTNVCRLLAQMFRFPFSFSRIKSKINGDIYYAMDAGNYGTLMAGLYSWRSALPVSGFYLPATTELCKDSQQNPVILDSFVDINNRKSISPIKPANIERLEDFFKQNQIMLRNFVFPKEISEKERELAAKELYMKYDVFADSQTSKAYATIKQDQQELYADDSAIVLVANNHPSLNADYCRHVLGESPEMPQNIKDSLKGVEINKPIITTKEELVNLIKTNF